MSRHSGVHLGLAVSVDEGLLVPVIRHADRLPLDELHEQAADLANRARAGKLMPDEMTGSRWQRRPDGGRGKTTRPGDQDR